MYPLSMPEELVRSCVTPFWNLGAIHYTDGVLRRIEADNLGVDKYLLRHLLGDYGILVYDPQDYERMVAARSEGRQFTSLFEIEEGLVKIVTDPMRENTVLCLLAED